MSHVLLLTTEPLPVPGSATTGAGLRAWGLAMGLQASGLAVTIGTPLHGDEQPSRVVDSDIDVRHFRRNLIAELIREISPTVVVLQHWGLASELPELHIPLAIDLAGPHLLERLYWGTSDGGRDLEEKLSALRRADFLVCSGVYQRHYFYPYLAMAGWDLRSLNFPVIPFSVPPFSPEHKSRPQNREITFVYGGAFLAWQDPSKSIAWLLQEMDSANSGRLLFYGGSHPVMDASGGRFTELADVLANHPRVEMRGWQPFQELLHEYRTAGDVAVDLMAWNPERELAFTTRTMVYLQCGLPVIYNNYSEVSAILSQFGAGWTFSADDEAGFRDLVRRIIHGTENLESRRAGALEAAAQYDWNKTVGPLAEFCHKPYFRTGKLEATLAEDKARMEAEQNAGKHSGKFSSARRRPARLLAPLVYVVGWALSLYLRLRMRNDLRST